MKMIENGLTKPMNSKISLSGMEFYAHHGCFEEEKKVGSPFVVDLVMEYDSTTAVTSDDVLQAVNYQSVYIEVKEVMKISVNLLETLSNSILVMLQEKFPQVVHAEVTVRKMNPALGGKTASASVTMGY